MFTFMNNFYFYGLFVLSTLYGIAIMLEMFFICRPMATAWYADVHGTCGDQVVSYVVLEIIGLFIDIAILVYPPIGISRLLMPRRKMVQISLVLSAGAL